MICLLITILMVDERLHTLASAWSPRHMRLTFLVYPYHLSWWARVDYSAVYQYECDILHRFDGKRISIAAVLRMGDDRQR
jgi:hypothetical protein